MMMIIANKDYADASTLQFIARLVWQTVNLFDQFVCFSLRMATSLRLE